MIISNQYDIMLCVAHYAQQWQIDHMWDIKHTKVTPISHPHVQGFLLYFGEKNSQISMQLKYSTISLFCVYAQPMRDDVSR